MEWLQYCSDYKLTAHPNEVETLFSKSAVLDMWDKLNWTTLMLINVKVWLLDFFIKAEMILLCMYMMFHIIYFQIIFYTIL